MLQTINFLDINIDHNKTRRMNFGTRKFTVDRIIAPVNLRDFLRPSAAKGSTRYFTLPILNELNIEEEELFENIHTHEDLMDTSSIAESVEEGEIIEETFKPDKEDSKEDSKEEKISSNIDLAQPFDLIAKMEKIDQKIQELKSPIPEFQTKSSSRAQMTSARVGFSHPVLSIFESSFHILNPKEQEFAIKILQNELDIEEEVSALSNNHNLIENKVSQKVTMEKFNPPNADATTDPVNEIYRSSLNHFILSYIHQNYEQNLSQITFLGRKFQESNRLSQKLRKSELELPNIEASGPRLQNTTTEIEFQEILAKIQIASQWEDPTRISQGSANVPPMKILNVLPQFFLEKQSNVYIMEHFAEVNSNFSDFVSLFKNISRMHNCANYDGFVIKNPFLRHRNHIFGILSSKKPGITAKFVQLYQEHGKDFDTISKELELSRRETIELYYYLKYRFPALRRKRKKIGKPESNIENDDEKRRQKIKTTIKWTDEEKAVAFDAFDNFGRDFKKITDIINEKNTGTPKTEQHIRTFFYNSRRKRKEEENAGTVSDHSNTPVATPSLEPEQLLLPPAVETITNAEVPRTFLKSSYWTADDKSLFNEALNVCGENWEELSKYMDYSKSPTQIKNYFNSFRENNLQEPKTPPSLPQITASMLEEARKKKRSRMKKAVEIPIDLDDQRLSSNIHEIMKRSPDELLRTQFDYANANLLRRASLQQRFQGPVPEQRLPPSETIQALSQLRNSLKPSMTNMTNPPQINLPTNSIAENSDTPDKLPLYTSVSSIKEEKPLPTLGFSKNVDSQQLPSLSFDASHNLPAFNTLANGELETKKPNTPPLVYANPPPPTLEQYIKNKLRDAKDK
eukprot:NODE_3_length_80033_cov_0.932970.p4 type:complete len:856 gc:universal NODE_3_length_80033_cov_0.932970:50375-47808(-)